MPIKDFFKKLSKDNIGTLASILAWSTLTSVVPILVGLVAITGFVLKSNPSAQSSVVSHLSLALHGVLTTKDIQNLVTASTQHTGILGIIGFVGILWGGANVGGAISTTFQAIFEVKGRNFIIEKLIDMVMVFVFAVLMIVIIVATSAASLVKQVFSSFPLPGAATLAIGTAISLVAAFLLFAAIYMVFPQVETRFKVGNVWKGALTAAILFEIITFIWPIYTKFAHFGKNGAFFGSVILLTAWIYFFSLITMLGAEVVAIGAIHKAQAAGQEVGPAPDNSVPSHEVLREGRPVATADNASADGASTSTPASKSS